MDSKLERKMIISIIDLAIENSNLPIEKQININAFSMLASSGNAYRTLLNEFKVVDYTFVQLYKVSSGYMDLKLVKSLANVHQLAVFDEFEAFILGLEMSL